MDWVIAFLILVWMVICMLYVSGINRDYDAIEEAKREAEAKNAKLKELVEDAAEWLKKYNEVMGDQDA